MEKATNGIYFPTQTTYFIAYTNEVIFAYGEVTSEQQMTSGQPILWQTLDRDEWVQKLINEFNTNPDEIN